MSDNDIDMDTDILNSEDGQDCDKSYESMSEDFEGLENVKAKPLSRSKLREHLFRLIFISDAQKEEPSKLFEVYSESLSFDDEDMPEAAAYFTKKDGDYIKNKADKIAADFDKLDKIIGEHSKGWSVYRLGRAELAILRLAVYEILFDDDIPAGVAINEAVELAKLYADSDAPAFINGILDSVRRSEVGGE